MELARLAQHAQQGTTRALQAPVPHCPRVRPALVQMYTAPAPLAGKGTPSAVAYGGESAHPGASRESESYPPSGLDMVLGVCLDAQHRASAAALCSALGAPLGL